MNLYRAFSFIRIIDRIYFNDEFFKWLKSMFLEVYEFLSRDYIGQASIINSQTCVNLDTRCLLTFNFMDEPCLMR